MQTRELKKKKTQQNVSQIYAQTKQAQHKNMDGGRIK
jgi:hypothetical protein